METLPIYNVTLGSDKDEVFAISLVDRPAIQSDFVAMNESEQIKLSSNEYKQTVTGAVLIPGLPIYRNHSKLGEHYIQFSAEIIEELAQKFFKNGNQDKTTHQHKIALNSNYVYESIIIRNEQMQSAFEAMGLGNLPIGTWLATMKIEDVDYFHTQVLPGKVRGFSIEAFLSKELKLQKYFPEKVKMKKSIVQSIKEFLSNLTALSTVTYTTADGSTFSVDEETKAVFENTETVSDGEYELEDGSVMVVAEGLLVEIKPKAETETPAETADSVVAETETEIPVTAENVSYTTVDGVEILVNPETQEAFINGETAADGEYPLADGSMLVVTSGKATLVPSAEVALRSQVAQLTAQLTELQSQVASKEAELTKLSQTPASKPISTTPEFPQRKLTFAEEAFERAKNFRNSK